MPTYHVDYLNGSNTTGNGSAAQPWATCLYAMQTGPIAANDTIKVAATGSDTVVSTTATFSSTNALVINTGVDLTSHFSAGSLFILSPNIPGQPEFNGWMIFEVASINSTTITVNTGAGGWAQLFPNYLSLTLSITKMGASPTIASTGNYEDFSAIPIANTQGVLIEGGYDPTFTTVVGYTNLFRGGTAWNSSTGSVFEVDNDTTMRVRNFRFSKFNQAGKTNFGGINYYDNICFNNCSTGFRGVTSVGIGTTGATNNFYLSNSSCGVISSRFTAETVNIFTYKVSRDTQTCTSAIDTSISLLGKLNFYVASSQSTTYGSLAGNSIGYSNMISIINGTRFGTVKVLIGEDNGRIPYIFYLNNGVDQDSSIAISKIIDNIEIIASTNHSCNLLNAQQSPKSFILEVPNSFDIHSFKPKWKDSSIYSAGQNYTVVKQDGTRFFIDGYTNQLIINDTTDYVTGNSSRKIKPIFSGTSIFNACALPIGFFRPVVGSQTIQSVTIKMKKSSNLVSNPVLSLSVVSAYGRTDTASPAVILSNTEWTDYTFTLNTGIKDILILDPSYESLMYLRQNPVPTATEASDVYYWIDSVTFNYA